MTDTPAHSYGALWLLAFASWCSETILDYMPNYLARVYDMSSLFFADMWRMLSGRWRASGIERCERPKDMLELYDIHASPDCAAVRETLSVLDIDHLVYPCPKESLTAKDLQCLNSRYRYYVKTETGTMDVPFLVDKSKNQKIIGSDQIIHYLWETYGSKSTPPINYRLMMIPVVKSLTLALSRFCRPSPRMGLLRAPSRKPERPLELWGFEGSMFVRRVQECLSTCEIPYVYHVMPWFSEKRKEFAKFHFKDIPMHRHRWGLVRVPFLRDPNTGAELFESMDICSYLQTKYQTAPIPSESWLQTEVTVI